MRIFFNQEVNDMSNPHNDGIEHVMVDRFIKYELPKLLGLKEKVDGGAKLADVEIQLMSNIVERARNFHRLVEVWPEYKPVIAQIIDTYNEISARALENESKP
jgi:hypothetical protein